VRNEVLLGGDEKWRLAAAHVVLAGNRDRIEPWSPRLNLACSTGSSSHVTGSLGLATEDRHRDGLLNRVVFVEQVAQCSAVCNERGLAFEAPNVGNVAFTSTVRTKSVSRGSLVDAMFSFRINCPPTSAAE
jgi:hypothetical protein